MVDEAFASFDGLQQGNEERSLVEGQPLKNIAIETDFSNHPRQHEVVMESMIIFKASTPLYEQVGHHVFVEFKDNSWGLQCVYG
jgi:hypothetical protein